MSKYLQVFKLAWQRNFEYRAYFFGHMILGLINIVVPVLIFHYAFTNGAKFGNYTFSGLFTYMVMTRFMHFASRGNIRRKIATEIKDGSFSNYFLKPISYRRYWFAYMLADRLFEIVIQIIILSTVLLLFPQFINLQAGNLPLFLIFIPIALLFNFFYSLLVASIAFYITDTNLFTTALGIVTGLFAGELVPIDLLPSALNRVSNWLPFRFTAYFPIMVYQGKVGLPEYLTSCFSLIVWILLFALFSHLVWRKGVKRYEAIGR